MILVNLDFFKSIRMQGAGAAQSAEASSLAVASMAATATQSQLDQTLAQGSVVSFQSDPDTLALPMSPPPAYDYLKGDNLYVLEYDQKLLPHSDASTAPLLSVQEGEVQPRPLADLAAVPSAGDADPPSDSELDDGSTVVPDSDSYWQVPPPDTDLTASSYAPPASRAAHSLLATQPPPASAPAQKSSTFGFNFWSRDSKSTPQHPNSWSFGSLLKPNSSHHHDKTQWTHPTPQAITAFRYEAHPHVPHQYQQPPHWRPNQKQQQHHQHHDFGASPPRYQIPAPVTAPALPTYAVVSAPNPQLSFSRLPPKNLTYPRDFPPMMHLAIGKKTLDKGFLALPPESPIYPHPFVTHDVNERDWLT